MIKHVEYLRKKIPADKNVFRAVYRYCFLLSRMQGQRNVQYEIAVEQWRMLFNAESGGVAANTATTPWLDWWIEFCEQNGKKPISKDLWEQLEVFLNKAHEDETLGWWSTDGAWPGAIDEFAAFVKEKKSANSEAMEVES
ncbi:hypothetical protein N7495_006411 [Penicillium taxi]|uniref:uncharacterized protein n=1 Tax=Penicillium taxi TaxID=168475 RepID=UPI00254550E0|nr:uncharacterized protein N7495_006411 [Penicillium taxi]KAJ5894720.1 hypothetical protein N7495_006411 [Penicillium taxi]